MTHNYYKRCKLDREYVDFVSGLFMPEKTAEDCLAKIRSVKEGKTYASVSSIQFVFDDKEVHMYVEGRKASAQAASGNTREEIWTRSIPESFVWASPFAKDYEEPTVDLNAYISEVAHIINHKSTYQVQRDGFYILTLRFQQIM